MIFRQLTPSGDWTFGHGISGYATAERAIELNIQTRLQSWVGDCFFAMGDFVDWVSRLNKGQEQNLVSELKSIILQSFGVVSIVDFSSQLNRDTRACLLKFSCITIYSTSFQSTLQLAIGG